LESRVVVKDVEMSDVVAEHRSKLSQFVGDMDGVLAMHKDTTGSASAGSCTVCVCVFVVCFLLGVCLILFALL
jgi:hypothetical protein